MTKRHDVRVGSRAPENGGPAPSSRPASCAVTAPPVYPTWAPSVSSYPTNPNYHNWPALLIFSNVSALGRSGGRPACRGGRHLAARIFARIFQRCQNARVHSTWRDARRYVGTSLLPAFSQWEKEIGRPAVCPSQALRHYAIPAARLLLPK